MASEEDNFVVIVAGSTSDSEFVARLTKSLDREDIYYEYHTSSAHKQTANTLDIINDYEKRNKNIVWITVAGRSNALSAVVCANSRYPVIACPPFKDKVDMMVNIHSTLQCPSKIPLLTVLDPDNAVLACKRILQLIK